MIYISIKCRHTAVPYWRIPCWWGLCRTELPWITRIDSCCTHGHRDWLQWKSTKRSQSKKRQKGKPDTCFPRPLPTGGVSWDGPSPHSSWVITRIKCCQPGKLMRDSGPRDYYYYIFFSRGIAMFPDSRREAGIEHKPDYLYGFELVTTLTSNQWEPSPNPGSQTPGSFVSRPSS